MECGYLSESDDSEEDSGMEHACQGGGGIFGDTESSSDDEIDGDSIGRGNACHDGIRGLVRGATWRRGRIMIVSTSHRHFVRVGAIDLCAIMLK